MRKIRKALAGAAILVTSAVQSWAAVTLTGDVAAGTGVLEIDSDLVFSITSDSANAAFIVFDEWGAPADGAQTSAPVTIPNNTFANGLLDNASITLGSVTPNDTLLSLTVSQNVSAGGSFTFVADTLPLDATASFNPLVGGTFNGDIWLIDGGTGERLSEVISAIPIPGAAWLFGSALLGLGVLKRRKA